MPFPVSLIGKTCHPNRIAGNVRIYSIRTEKIMKAKAEDPRLTVRAPWSSAVIQTVIQNRALADRC